MRSVPLYLAATGLIALGLLFLISYFVLGWAIRVPALLVIWIPRRILRQPVVNGIPIPN